MIDLLKKLVGKAAAKDVESPRAAPQPAVDVANLPGGSETVLVVDDEPDIVESMQTILEQLGYKVVTAHDGEEAYRLVQRHPRQPIDLLLTDVVMPHVNGKELAYLLRTAVPKHRVILCSAYPGELATRNGMLPDDFAFLQKPVSAKLLAETVRQILDRAGELDEAAPVFLPRDRQRPQGF